MKYNDRESIDDLCSTFLLLKNQEEVINFLKDLCTPKEIKTLSERWVVCKLLNADNLSYREIQHLTGASLTTIGRVARFLRTESYMGYKVLLNRINEKKSE